MKKTLLLIGILTLILTGFAVKSDLIDSYKREVKANEEGHMLNQKMHHYSEDQRVIEISDNDE